MSDNNSSSPNWSTNIKFVVALTLAAILIGLFVQFRAFVAPLLVAFILAYLVNPLAERLHHNLKIPWRLAASLMYFLIVIVLLGLLTWGGFTVVEQVQALIGFVQNTINSLPAIIDNLTQLSYHIGPFSFDFQHLDLQAVNSQVLPVIQSLLTRLGSMVGTIAASAATTVGWILFTMLISYFISTESGGKSRQLIYFHIPGYEADLARMGWELGRIWNAFLRGQFLIISLTIGLYTIMLGTLGLKYYFGLALLAGMARFIPYIGPAIAWTTYGLVAYFQGPTLFGLPSLSYGLMIVGIAWVTDNIIDSFITPRIMADTLSVHPAAVMVVALIAANLFGVVGVILSAPSLASIKLIFNYAFAKLQDRDPWMNVKAVSPPQPIASLILRIQTIVTAVNGWYNRWLKPHLQAWFKVRPRKPSEKTDIS